MRARGAAALTLAALALVLALAFAGCSSSTDLQGEALAFLHAHAAGAQGVAAATRSVEAHVAAATGGDAQARARLLREAGRARRAAIRASEWNPASHSEAASEEEDLPRAEAEVTEAAEELVRAMTAIEGYSRGRLAARQLYIARMAHAREQWDEGIAQLWFLAGRRNPPTL